MATNNPDSRDRFWETLNAAVSDLRSAQASLHEAQRLGNKYGIGDRGVVADGLLKVNEVADRLTRLAGRDGTGSPCFPGAALVETPMGRRPIASIQPGDRVLSWSPRTGELVVRIVARVLAHSPRELYVVRCAEERRVITTPNHRFLTTGGWLRTDHLRNGDLLVRTGGTSRPAQVLAVEPTGRCEPVYNLITTGEHSYLVEGFVVHNFTHFAHLRTWWHRLVLDRRARKSPRGFKADLLIGSTHTPGSASLTLSAALPRITA